MDMKKTIAIMMLSISAVSFAKGGGQGNSQTKSAGKQDAMMMQQQQHMVTLNPEQQKEFYEMNKANIRKTQNYTLQIRETELQMEKELLKDKPNMRKLDKLTEKKAAFAEKREKAMLKHSIQMKEKFGMNYANGQQSRVGIQNNKRNRPQHMKKLNPEQEMEFKKKNALYMQNAQQHMIRVREINLQMHKEMLAEKPNMEKLNMLTEQRIKVQADMEKERLRHRIEMRDKFNDFMMEDSLDHEFEVRPEIN